MAQGIAAPILFHVTFRVIVALSLLLILIAQRLPLLNLIGLQVIRVKTRVSRVTFLDNVVWLRRCV